MKEMETVNINLQNKLTESKQENIELKAKYELELQDYKNAMANLELKYAGLSQNSSIHVKKILIFLKKVKKFSFENFNRKL